MVVVGWGGGSVVVVVDMCVCVCVCVYRGCLSFGGMWMPEIVAVGGGVVGGRRCGAPSGWGSLTMSYALRVRCGIRMSLLMRKDTPSSAFRLLLMKRMSNLKSQAKFA